MEYDRFQPGQIVRVLRGSPVGEYAIVVRIDEPPYLWLADKEKYSVDHPKRKNRKHVQPTNYIDREIAQLLREGRLTDAKLRHALKLFLLQRKGE